MKPRSIVILIPFLVAIGSLDAQEIFSSKVRRFVIYGSTTASLPVAGLSSSPVTIEWDLRTSGPPDVQLRFIHCDRNWNPTSTAFVNDPIRDRTRVELGFDLAPNGVEGYTHTSKVRIPQEGVFDRFPFSGNYIVELWDLEDDERLAVGRFFVAEKIVKAMMTIGNRLDPAEVSPYYHVHKASVKFTVPEDSTARDTYYRSLFSTVDIYRNREIGRRWRIDSDDMDRNTFVNGFGTNDLEFMIENIRPGNEYRVIDLRSEDFYPGNGPHRPRLGADVSRFLQKPVTVSERGFSLIRGNRYADYLTFTFELLWNGNGVDPLYVVGDFNGWRPSPAFQLTEREGRMVLETHLRRGRYEYQYVLGDDWIILEGNDWRTINMYTAFVYYRDQRFGGFDRILGVATARSPGGVTATTH